MLASCPSAPTPASDDRSARRRGVLFAMHQKAVQNKGPLEIEEDRMGPRFTNRLACFSSNICFLAA